MSATYEAKAKAVLGELARRDRLPELANDSPFLDFLMQLLQQLLPMLLQCFAGNTANATAQLHNPSLFIRMRLRMLVHNAIRDQESANYFTTPVCDAVWKVAKDTTEADVKNLVVSPP